MADKPSEQNQPLSDASVSEPDSRPQKTASRLDTMEEIVKELNREQRDIYGSECRKSALGG